MININKRSLSDQIYTLLKTEILQNKISFGSKLVNRSLQERFGVSSSPIRDAINRLYQDGLITTIDKTGATVVELDYDTFVEINEILLYIVNTGIKLSSEKSNPEEVCSRLKDNIDLQEKHIGTDEFYDYDYKFHKTFIDYSYNSRLKKIFKEYNVLHEMLVRYFYKPESMQIQEGSIEIHRHIMKAYCKGDYEEARRLTEGHYKAAERIFKEIFKENQIK